MVKKVFQRVTDEVKDKKKNIRRLCFLSGVILLLALIVKSFFPWTDVYFGAAIFYMVILLVYVIAKTRAEKMGAPYSKTWIGEWLGIAWIAVFTALWVANAILTFLDPVKYEGFITVPEEMAWIAGETAVLFFLSDPDILFSFFKNNNSK